MTDAAAPAAAAPAPANPEYSRAFENLVGDDSDLVGLLAYALFKQSVREAVLQGQGTAFSRNPPASVVNTYRLSAARRLEQFGTSITEDQRADLLEDVTVEAIEAATAEIKRHVAERTSFLPALGVNMTAWVITLAITVLIIWLSGKAEPAEALVNTAQRAEAARSAVQSPGQPQLEQMPKPDE